MLGKANTDNDQHGSGPQHVLLLHQYFQGDNEPSKVMNYTRPRGVDAEGKLLPANLRDNVRRFEHYYLEDFQATYPKLKVIISEYGLDGRIGLHRRSWPAPVRGWKYFDECVGCLFLQTTAHKTRRRCPLLEALSTGRRTEGIARSCTKV